MADLRKFARHLEGHYKNGETWRDWSVTTYILNLLAQEHVASIWYRVFTARFGTAPGRWPTLSWSVQGASKYMKRLEYDVTEVELQSCLPSLLEAGLAPSNRRFVYPCAL